MPPLELSRYAPDERMRRLARHLETHEASPLFVLLADGLLRRDEAAAATTVLLRGLSQYPQYPTARLLLARAYVLLRRYAEARVILVAVLDQMPACSGARALLDRMTELEVTHPPLAIHAGPTAQTPAHLPARGAEVPPRNWSRDDSLIPGLEDSDVQEMIGAAGTPAWTPAVFDLHSVAADELFAPPQTDAPAPEDTTTDPGIPWEEDIAYVPLDDAPLTGHEGGITDLEEAVVQPSQPGAPGFSLELLASRLEGARIPILPDGGAFEGLPDEDSARIDAVDLDARPVTETLASIYFQQGRLQEALIAYRNLRARMPDRSIEFTLRIAEIEGRLAGRI